MKRVLQERKLDAVDGTPVRTWTYCFGGNLTGCSSLPQGWTSAMIDPDGNETWRISSSAITTGTTVQYQGSANSGIVLQKAVTIPSNVSGQVFWRTAGPEPILTCETDTTHSDGSISVTTVNYDPPIPVVDPDSVQICTPTNCGGNSLSTSASRSIGIPIAHSVTNYGNPTAGSTLKATTIQFLWQTDSRYLQANFLRGLCVGG